MLQDVGFVLSCVSCISMLISVVAIAVAYLVGSVPSSYLIAKWVGGIDIRTYGSGNVGASNISTHVGKVWIVPVALFDVFVKGWVPVYVVGDRVLGLGDATEALVALAAVAGHNWPVFLRFSGGRAISVAIGALGAFATPLIVLFGTLPVIMALATPWRDSGLWWLITVALMPVWAWLMVGHDATVYFCVGFAVLMVVRRATSGGISWQRVVINRIVFDRDIADREQWVHRRPEN